MPGCVHLSRPLQYSSSTAHACHDQLERPEVWSLGDARLPVWGPSALLLQSCTSSHAPKLGVHSVAENRHGIYGMVYIILYMLVYSMVYNMVYTMVYLNSLVNCHSWHITRCWYRKITQQCINICSFESRQAVTKFRQRIPLPGTLSAACTARWQCIIVVFPVPSAPIQNIIQWLVLWSCLAVLRDGGKRYLASL